MVGPDSLPGLILAAPRSPGLLSACPAPLLREKFSRAAQFPQGSARDDKRLVTTVQVWALVSTPRKQVRSCR